MSTTSELLDERSTEKGQPDFTSYKGLLTSRSHQWNDQDRSQLVNQGKNGDFPGDPVVKNPLSNAGNMGSISGLEIFHIL